MSKKVHWVFPDGSRSEEPEPRKVKIAPAAPKRIRPTSRMSPLAVKLLAVGLAQAQVR